MNLREISFGTPVDDPDGYCIYCLGHVESPEAFLHAVRDLKPSEIPLDARQALTVDDVEFIRFRPMSPSEARGYGLTWGVMQVPEGETNGYPVTAVKL